MAGWTNIPDGNLEPGSPIRSADGLALRENPIAIAERANNAPRVAPNSHQKLTGSGSFTVPDGVTRLSLHIVGAGGPGGNGSYGGTTSIAGNSAGGGQDEKRPGGSGYTADGQGGGGSYSAGGSSGYGTGGGYGDGTDGGGGGGNGGSGSGGGYTRAEINVTPGQSVNYSCGAGGTSSGSEGNGGDGFIIVEY